MKSYGLTVRGIIKNDSGEILIVKRHPKSRTDPEMWELSVAISEEHTEYMWASIEKIESLELSSSLKKLLEKRNYEL